METGRETKIRGDFAKIGAAAEGVIADAHKIVVVDCQPFSGSCRFPVEMVKGWMQGGDNACLVEPWVAGATKIYVRRQGTLDGPGEYSGRIESFLVSSSCMPERHVVSINWVNMLAGVYHANPAVAEPSIFLWLSNRRGVPVEEDVSEYLQFISKMSGPISVQDVILSPKSNFSGVMTNTQYAAIEGSDGFAGLVLDLKPDFAMNGGMVVFLTLWREVWACRSRGQHDYLEALRANCVHRSFYDFERFLFEITATLDDVRDVSDMHKINVIIQDYVSARLFIIF